MILNRHLLTRNAAAELTMAIVDKLFDRSKNVAHKQHYSKKVLFMRNNICRLNDYGRSLNKDNA